jgi:hypothetical protein
MNAGPENHPWIRLYVAVRRLQEEDATASVDLSPFTRQSAVGPSRCPALNWCASDTARQAHCRLGRAPWCSRLWHLAPAMMWTSTPAPPASRVTRLTIGPPLASCESRHAAAARARAASHRAGDLGQVRRLQTPRTLPRKLAPHPGRPGRRSQWRLHEAVDHSHLSGYPYGPYIKRSRTATL